MIRRDFLRLGGLGMAGLAMGGCLSVGTGNKKSPRPVNIVIIYADDLGYGDVGCYGATRVKTPNIDRLAAEGLRFTNAHCTSATCTPSRYALLTGEYPWRKKGTNILPGDARLIIQPGRTTLPSMLKKAGYTTGAIGKWHLGLGAGTINWNGDITPGPREIGFDYSFLIPATGDRVPCVFAENQRVVGLDPRDPIEVNYDHSIGNEPTGKNNPELLRLHPSHGHNQTIVNGISRIGYMTGGKSARWVDENIADTITGKAVSFIEKNKAVPFFFYFATHDIHVPRVPHPRFAGKTGLGPRGDAIVEFDWSVGEIAKTLERLNLANDTILIVTSDNGPVVDDGYKDQAVEKLNGHKPAGPLRGGKYSAFDGGTRVPFVLRWPGRVKPGVSDALVSQVDFLNSFAVLTGRKLATEDAPDSLNVLPAFLGESRVGRDHVVEHAASLSIIKGNWKYIEPGREEKFKKLTGTEMGTDPKEQLYNLAADLGEKKNVADQNPKIVAELAAMLKQLRVRGRSRP